MSCTLHARAVTLYHPSPPAALAPSAITPRARIVTRALSVTPRHIPCPLTAPDPLRHTHVHIPPDLLSFVDQIVSMYFLSIPAYFSYHSL